MTDSKIVLSREPSSGAIAAAIKRRPEVGLSLLLLVVFLGGWEVIVRLFAIPAIVVPAPTAIAQALWINLNTSRFYYHIGVTLWEILAGFAIGATVGLIIGVSIGQSKLLEKTVYPYVVAFQTVPKVAIAPMIVIWFGYGISSKIVITALIAFFPVVVNCIVGMNAAPPQQIDMLRSFTASRWQIFRMVKLQTALPYIFAGLDVAVVLAVIGAIVGEFIGAQAGLGYLLLQRNFSMDTAGSFAILIVLSLIGVGLHQVMSLLRQRVVFWVERDDIPANEST
ncbi:ABC transporter permease [Rhizobium sp. ARZ01]|uniref:ABC transporter permease n=1 Tax=Rhizobium sp. ARZ01 TaxID=2769313 RepID=UPI00177FA959|nr:ABC transporter permease [Rhizobium sp. ARZ01]MBD9375424.1 ABC transporter permease [Rhizobium sp. ARZ01]